MSTVYETLEQAKRLHGAGRLQEAEPLYHQVLAADPANLEARYLLGATQHGLGKPLEALASLEQVIRARDDFAEAHYYLGVVLAQLGRTDQAIAHYQRSLALKPSLVHAHYGLGVLLARANRRDEAADCYHRAIALHPSFPEAYNELGTLLLGAGRMDEAAACYRNAVELKGDFAEAHYNLGLVHSAQNKPAEAVVCYQRAVELKPAFAEAHYNLGNTMAAQNQVHLAASAFQRALELKPDFADAHYNRALAHLMAGEFSEGWPKYEWRWKRTGVTPPVRSGPWWDGGELHGGTVLLHCEQGLGDTLQFVRYAELVRERGGRVVVACPAPLAPLVQSCPGVERTVIYVELAEEFAVHAPLMSLPAILGTTLDSVPGRVPYLSVDETLIDFWKTRLSGAARLKIGIAWQGNPTHLKDHFRSIPLSQFARLAALPDVQLYSLQMGAGREQIQQLSPPMRLIDLSDRPEDFQHTAAIMRQLDLVISCDSAPAHLAGALGVPVWVPLPLAADWRWMLDREDSPWYPTMRLFRQRRIGDWAEVFERIEKALDRFEPRASEPSTR